MNFTAHLHLSPNIAEVRVFNFSGDGFKGNAWRGAASPPQRLGIDLHRFIDDYTDQHPLTKAAKKHIRPFTGKYSAVALDLLGDYFLQRNWEGFRQLQASSAQQSLTAFIASAESDIAKHKSLLKGRAAAMAPYLLEHHWLLSYREIDGLLSAARGIAQRHPGGAPLVDFFEGPVYDCLAHLEEWFFTLYPMLMLACQEFVQNHNDWEELSKA
jgi:acyl carrier protein phosphodiesterase